MHLDNLDFTRTGSTILCGSVGNFFTSGSKMTAQTYCHRWPHFFWRFICSTLLKGLHNLQLFEVNKHLFSKGKQMKQYLSDNSNSVPAGTDVLASNVTSDYLMKITDVSQVLRLSRSATYNVINQGELKTVKIGNKSRRIRYSDLMSYISGLQSVEVAGI